VLDDPEVPAAADAVKLWSVAEMKPLTPPAVGQRAQVIAWLAREEPYLVRNSGLMASLFEHRVSVFGSAIAPESPNLIEMLETGLISLEDSLVGTATESHQFTGPPMVFRHIDSFGQLIRTAGDPSVHLRLCAELSQAPTARLIWQDSAGKRDEEARHDYVLLMAGAGMADEAADAVTKSMMEDPSIAAGLMTLRRKLPAEAQAKFKDALKDKAPTGWLEQP
jgi:hypothetical protein